MEEIARAKVIALGNQKGGVGKTTNCVQIAAALAEKGRRCLIWDLDMNFGSTRHFGIPAGTYWGTYELLTGQEEIHNVIITENDADVNLPNNINIITADRNLEGLEKGIAAKHRFFPAGILVEPLRQVRAEYDYIFLDTAPSASTATLAAYMAADYFILSTTPQQFSIQGLEDAVTDIKGAIGQGNKDLTILGVVVSDVHLRTRIAAVNVPLIEDIFRPQEGQPSAKFDTVISRSTVVGEAQKEGKTLFQTHPTHKITEQYRALSQEIEDRIHAFISFGESEAPQREEERGNG